MKTHFILILCSLWTLNTWAQYTSGGNKKQYDKVVQTEYDTIWKDKKKDPPMPKASVSFSMGMMFPNSNYKSEMDYNKWMTYAESAAGLRTGQMGGKTGFVTDFSLYLPLNLANRNLNPIVDIGTDWSFSLGFMPFDLSYTSDHWVKNSGSGSTLAELTDEITGTYKLIGLGFGPRATFNPLGIDNPLRIDIGFRFQPTWARLPYMNDLAYDTNNVEYTYTLELAEGGGASFSKVVWAAVRYNNFQFGIRKQFGVVDESYYYESLENYYGTQYIIDVPAAVDLSNFQVFLAIQTLGR